MDVKNRITDFKNTEPSCSKKTAISITPNGLFLNASQIPDLYLFPICMFLSHFANLET